MQERVIELFSYDSSMDIGIAEIDGLRRQFLTLANKLANHIANGSSNSILIPIIEDSIVYAAEHFEIEENYYLNAQLEVSEIKEHQQHHQQFTEELSHFKEHITTEPQGNYVEEFFSFLIQWIASHALESDNRLGFIALALQKGIDIPKAKHIADEKVQLLANGIATDLLTINSLRLVQALAKLSLSEERLQEAMQYAKIGYWDLPINSKQAYWSPEMYELFGLSTDSISGPETLCSIMNEDYHKPFYCSVSTAFDTGCEHHVEYPIVRPSDGAIRWIECRGKVVYKIDGSPEKLTGFVQDITERKENESRIEQLAYYDPLTHLPNRRLLLERLNQKLASSGRSQYINALLFLDIDNFKKLNDIHGHEYGDLLLAQTAIRISQSIRSEDTASRVGGDEFVIILDKLSKVPIKAATQVEQITHKILHALAQPYQINEIHYATSCSVGIVLFSDDSLSASEIMKQADIAMYQAKQAGRNTLCFFDPDMQKDMTERVTIESELRKAISEHQFELFYQPQCNQHGEVLGSEALIRWNHPSYGLTSPQYFISIAEDTGLIIPIGEWVIKAACSQLKVWQTKPETRHLSLSINVSHKQFQQPDFVLQIKQTIQEYEVDPNKLKVELTESVLAKDLEFTVIRMRELGDMGIQLSLDDFGTGYSSLQYLKTLPLYQLKIDYSFVRDLMTDPNDRSIVKTIISMAKGLGLNVIAEGVETKEQKEYLLQKGCMLYQGFLFSKPVPINKFEMLLVK